MRVRTKMLLSMTLLAALVLFIVGVTINTFQVRQKMIFEQETALRQGQFRDVLRNYLTITEKMTKDYAFWNEFADYLSTLDEEWAEVNIRSPFFDTYHMDAVWVFAVDGTVVRMFSPDDQVLPSPVRDFKGFAQKISSQTPVVGFVASTDKGVMWIFGSAIQHVTDQERDAPHAGYLVVGQLVDAQAEADLSKAVLGKVRVVQELNAPVPVSSQADGAYRFAELLLEEDAKPLARLDVAIKDRTMALVHRFINALFLFCAVLCFLTIVIPWAVVGTWVQRPLRLISQSLELSREPTVLAPLLAEQDEFGQVARLMKDFVAQKEALQRQKEEQARTQKDLADSEGRFKTLVENFPGVIYRCVLKPRWEFLYISDAIEELTGYSAEAFRKREMSYPSLIHPEDHLKTSMIMQGAVASKERYSMEYRIVRGDGSVRWIFDRGQAEYGASGEVLCLDGVIFDITDRKKGEEDIKKFNEKLVTNEKALKNILYDMKGMYDTLKSTQAQLLQSEKMASIGQLSAGIAHEIKNPLAIILLGLDSLETAKASLTQRQNEYLQMIKDASIRANRIIQELLSFTRLSSSSFQPVSLVQVVENSISLLQKAVKSKVIRIEKEFTDPEALIVDGDAILLEQAILNILSNSADAIGDEGRIMITGRVVPTTSPGGKKAVLRISDTGTGIDKAILSRIFEPFFTTKDQGKGTGLGLSTVYMIIEKHGGKITAESEVGAGTTFLITLPAKFETGTAAGRYET